MSEPKKKPFESQKKFEARKRAEEITSGYVHRGLKRVSRKQETYQQRCGHCSGKKVMSNGKDCLNCGGQGTITRVR